MGFCSTAFDSEDFDAAIAPVAFMIKGEATAAELKIINFLLLNFELVSVIHTSFFKIN